MSRVWSQSVCCGSKVGGARVSLEAELKGKTRNLGPGLALRVELKGTGGKLKVEPGWLYDVVIHMWMA